MAEKIINASATWNQRQGTYGSNIKNKQITMSFSGINALQGKVITSAVLALTCEGGGHNGVKTLSVSLGGGTYTNYTTTSNAYKQITTIVLSTNDVTTWIKNGNYSFVSKDPQETVLSHISSDGTKYSTNYLVISKASLLIIYEEGQSDFTLSTSILNVSAEKSYPVQLTVNNHISGYTYNVELIMDDNHIYKLVEDATSSSFSFEVLSSESEIYTEVLKDKTSATGTLKLTAYYNGTEKYNKTQAVTLALADEKDNSYLPLIAAILGASETSTEIDGHYYLLAGNNNFKAYLVLEAYSGASITNITAQYTDETTIYSFTFDDLVNSFLTIPAPITGGAKNILFTATDTRGYTKTVSMENVYASPYNLPTFSSATITRTDRSGVASPVSGTYAKIEYEIFYTDFILDINGENEYSLTNDITLKQNNTTYLSPYSGKIIGGSFDPSQQYMFNLTIKDSIGKSITKILILPSSAYLLHFSKGKNSVAIGTVAPEADGLFTVAWPANFTDSLTVAGDLNLTSPLPITSGGTGSMSSAGAFQNIVEPGGTITGELILQGATSIKSAGKIASLALETSNGGGKIKICEDDEGTRFCFDYLTNQYYLPAREKGDTDKSYEILTSKDLDFPTYSAGDTLEIAEAYAYGWTKTNAYSKIYLCFPLKGQIASGASVSVTALNGEIRASNNYLLTLLGDVYSGNADTTSSSFLNGIEQAAWIKEQGIIYIKILSNVPFTNIYNSSVSYRGSLSLSFK